MEIGPEFVVLQSAFQLLKNQVGDKLGDLEKGKCDKYLPIITTAVEEICRGLQYDLEADERLLWHQKLHAILFYGLVRNKYKPLVKVQNNCGLVSRLDTLDIMSTLLPETSCQFYFEIVKHCDWTALFLQSLKCVDQTTASTLLNEGLKHCRQDPISVQDFKMVAIVTETFLSRCLHIPEEEQYGVTSELLQPLMLSRAPIQTIFPDEEAEPQVAMETDLVISEGQGECDETHAKGQGQSDRISVQEEEADTRAGCWFFENHVENNPDLLPLMLNHIGEGFRRTVSGCTSAVAELHGVSMMDHYAAVLGLLWYLHYQGSSEYSNSDWMVANLFSDDQTTRISGAEKNQTQFSEIAFMVNGRLSRQIADYLPLSTLQELIDEVLKCLVKADAHSDNDGCRVVRLVPGVCVKSSVLRRLLLRDESAVDTRAAEDGERAGIQYGEEWSRDVTLDALLWRIQHNLPYSQDCVDKLLTEECWSFWTMESLLQVLKDRINMFSRKDRILRLLQILQKQMEVTQQRDVTVQLQEFFIMAFAELSFHDQDIVIMSIQQSGKFDMPALLPGHLTGNTTNVFNKITADVDTQVIQELMVLCLVEPVAILDTLIHRSIANTQQATQSAMVLSYLKATCTCLHHRYTGGSLLTCVLREFLLQQDLSEKSQKHLCHFVALTMADSSKQVFHPVEFMHLIVLPFLSADNLTNLQPHPPITIKLTLTLLKECLAHVSNDQSDWCKFEFEPIAVSVTLCEILHECGVLWETEDDGIQTDSGMTRNTPDARRQSPDNDKLNGEKIDNNRIHNEKVNDTTMDENTTSQMSQARAVEQGNMKLSVKQTVLECLTILAKLFNNTGCLSKCDADWLMLYTGGLHWTVQLRLSYVLQACGHAQYFDHWQVTISRLVADFPANMAAVLQLVSLTKISHLQTIITEETGKLDCPPIAYEELVCNLVQVMPQLLVDEFLQVAGFVQRLITSSPATSQDWIYRLKSTPNVSLHDLSGLQPILYTSQLLSDVIITIATCMSPGALSASMLQYVVHNYASYIKTQCERPPRSSKQKLLCLAELFHHVCCVTLNSPPEVTDITMVILMHIATKYKEIVAVATSASQGQGRLSGTMQGQGQLDIKTHGEGHQMNSKGQVQSLTSEGQLAPDDIKVTTATPNETTLVSQGQQDNVHLTFEGHQHEEEQFNLKDHQDKASLMLEPDFIDRIEEKEVKRELIDGNGDIVTVHRNREFMNVGYVNRLNAGMVTTAHCLPGESEEKLMLIKKLND